MRSSVSSSTNARSNSWWLQPRSRAPVNAAWTTRSRLAALHVRAAAWTRRIDERIEELKRLRAGLTQCIGCGCLSLKQCRLANPGDWAARLGPGPRYWIGNKRRSRTG